MLIDANHIQEDLLQVFVSTPKKSHVASIFILSATEDLAYVIIIID